MAAETQRAGNLGEDVQHLYTASSGLLSTATTAIAQTSDGFIWVGGYGGLVRYDGRSFEKCMEGELKSVQSLLADDRGGLWIAANDLGLIYFRDNNYTRISTIGGNEAVMASALAMGPDGRVWFGTESGIGYIDDAMQTVMADVSGLEDKYISQLLPTQDGAILCVARNGELYQVNGQQAERVDLRENTNNVRSVSYDALRNHYLVGTMEDNFLILDAGMRILQVVNTPGLNCINDLLLDANGVTWLCSDSGVGSYDGRVVRAQSLELDNSIDHMMVDQEGSYWFVSSRQGVLEVCPCRFGDVTRSAGLPNVVVNAVTLRDDRIYIGHDDGVQIIDAKTYRRINDSAFSDLEGVRVRSILNDDKGGLWFFTKGKGVLHFDVNNECHAYSSEDYPVFASNTFRCGTVDGDVVLAGSDIGAYRIEGESVSTIVNADEGFNRRVLCISGTKEHCWLGTDGYGLYEVRDGSIVKHLGSEDGLGSNVVMKIVPGQAQGGLWFVLGNGLAWMNESGEIQQVQLGSNGNVLDFIILDDGHVWIPTGAGIINSSEEALLAGDAAKIRLFQSSDGVPYEVTPNSNQCLREDVLYLCGTGGVGSLDLAKDVREQESYSLILDYVMVDGEKVYVEDGNQVIIRPDARRIDFDVHVLTFQPEKPDVYYYLEGFDNERTVASLASLGDITYTNLNAGNYVFHFGTVDSQGRGELGGLRVTLVKQPYWHELLWVRLGGVVLAVALVGLLVWRYVRKRVHDEETALRQKLEAEERAHLRSVAYKDYLTGLYNRSYLSHWNESIFPETSLPLFFVAMDCNDLKQVNDRYGHSEGDHLLKELTALLKDEFQDEGTLFRTGGDEFLLLIGDLSRDELDERLQRIHEKASQVHIKDITLSFCEGIYEMRDNSCGFEEAITKADMDLLHNKDIYHGRV